MNSQLSIRFFIFFCAWFVCVSLSAKETLVIVRGDGDYYPMEYVGDDGVLQGFHIELIDEVARQLDFDVEVKSLPWSRAQRVVMEGGADAITHISKRPEREKQLIYLKENILSVVSLGFFVREIDRGRYSYSGDLESLKKFTFGGGRGFNYGPFLNGIESHKLDCGAKDELEIIQKLLLGRFDIGIGSVNSIAHMARKLGVADKITFLKPYFSLDPVYIAFSRKRIADGKASKFSTALSAFKKTKKYTDFLKKYGVEKY